MVVTPFGVTKRLVLGTARKKCKIVSEDVPRCINIERYFSVYIKKFGNVRFDEVLRVFPLLPKSYLNE